MQKGSADIRDVSPDIKEVQLICDGLGGRQDAHYQPLSVSPHTSEVLMDISFFIRMPQAHSPVANSSHTPPDLLKDELLIATKLSRLTATGP